MYLDNNDSLVHSSKHALLKLDFRKLQNLPTPLPIMSAGAIWIQFFTKISKLVIWSTIVEVPENLKLSYA